jgi:hypothetical protein
VRPGGPRLGAGVAGPQTWSGVERGPRAIINFFLIADRISWDCSRPVATMDSRMNPICTGDLALFFADFSDRICEIDAIGARTKEEDDDPRH